MGQRYQIKDSMEIEIDIDVAILRKNSELQEKFRKQWGKHRCNVTGCGQCLVVDGGQLFIFCAQLICFIFTRNEKSA